MAVGLRLPLPEFENRSWLVLRVWLRSCKRGPAVSEGGVANVPVSAPGCLSPPHQEGRYGWGGTACGPSQHRAVVGLFPAVSQGACVLP